MRRQLLRRDNLLAVAAVLLAGTAPNLFVAAQAGYADLATLGKFVLIPSILALFAIGIFSTVRYPLLARRLVRGALAGMIATLGLELIREIGFHMGFMPGDLPRLMGVRLLGRFMEGPSLVSDLAGWGYHFWNGASFGMVFALLIGGRRWWAGVISGQLIAFVFMAGPAVTALGIGRFGISMGAGFPAAVILAHLAYGSILGALVGKWVPERGIVLEAVHSIKCGCSEEHVSTEKSHLLDPGRHVA